MKSHAGLSDGGPPGPAHPYLDWAIETGFAYLRPGAWLPLLVEFDDALSRERFTNLWLGDSFKDAVRVPALFDEASNRALASATFNFCVLLIHRDSAANLIRDPVWKQTIRSAELGPPIDLPSPRPGGARANTPPRAKLQADAQPHRGQHGEVTPCAAAGLGTVTPG